MKSMSLFNIFKTKLWKIDDHRVKKFTKKQEVRAATHPVQETVTRYRCVDCEKTHKSVDKFRNDECYEVVYE
jgi:hypothetical protein